MIKATISKTTKREAFARAGAKKIGSGMCAVRPALGSVVLDSYKVIATGFCSEKKMDNDLNNIIMFKKQKEVA